MIQPATNDPLRHYRAGAWVRHADRPMPLVSTRFDIQIASGVVAVTTTRTFRNAESQSIEATITFPVPVHAVLYHLEARIDGRVLRARAQRRAQARETYEGAIDSGKTAVLHEEVLKGVHMLSVGHVPPGAEISVTTRWADTLAWIGGEARTRIPLTVGDIYGRSPLPDSDDLIHGGPVQMADLTVASDSGSVSLEGTPLIAGSARVPLNRPIDLVVLGWRRRALSARAADDQTVSLAVAPAASHEAALNAAVLVDHSGSMSSRVAGSVTAHDAVVVGLRRVAKMLDADWKGQRPGGRRDELDLWEFDNSVRRVGMARTGAELEAAVSHLAPPSGGTETGGALQTVIQQSECRDIVLVTDGKSHALDVQALARSGRRMTVVLVGEDSLAANVGHLAALTGGEIFVAAGADIADAIVAALEAARRPRETHDGGDPRRRELCTHRAGMVLTAHRGGEGPQVAEGPMARAVPALVASLLLPRLEEDAAAALAEAEGLVCHLTSLVLVDEAGSAQEGLPATRKVPLPSPAAAVLASSARQRMLPVEDFPAVASRRVSSVERASDIPGPAERAVAPAGQQPRGFLQRLVQGAPNDAHGAAASTSEDLSRIARSIDWSREPERLRRGDLSVLSAEVAREVRRAAALSEVQSAAKALGIDAVVLVIGLLARFTGASDRHAARLARVILPAGNTSGLDRVTHILGLGG